MGMKMNLSLKMVIVAIFIVLNFAVAGLIVVTSLTGSPVLAQNETGANKTALYSNQTGMVAETKR
jgi:hypothetical protein